jgi:hypothetical protein
LSWLPTDIFFQLGDDNSKKTRNKKSQRRQWSNAEKDAIYQHLDKFVKKGGTKLPGKRDCVACIEKSGDVLKSRDWRTVKYCVRNMVARNKKLPTQGKGKKC